MKKLLVFLALFAVVSGMAVMPLRANAMSPLSASHGPVLVAHEDEDDTTADDSDEPEQDEEGGGSSAPPSHDE